MSGSQLTVPALLAMKAASLAPWLIDGFNEKTVNVLTAFLEYQQENNQIDAEVLLNSIKSYSLEELQTAWTTMFCIGKDCVPPEESVVLTGLSMQEPRDKSLSWYLSYGQKLATNVPPDNLGVQLMFLSNLLFAINELDGSEKKELIKKAKDFSEERLGWVGSLIELLDRKERPESSKVIFDLLDETQRFINEELEYLRSIS